MAYWAAKGMMGIDRLGFASTQILLEGLQNHLNDAKRKTPWGNQSPQGEMFTLTPYAGEVLRLARSPLAMDSN